MWVYYNPNPRGRVVDDCVIRAVAKALKMNWYEAFDELSKEAKFQADRLDANSVWDSYLLKMGFVRDILPNTCPLCYTVSDFANDHPTGMYVLGTGTHAVTVVDGDYYDTWDSGDKVPIYFYRKERGD